MKKVFFHSYKGGVGRSYLLVNVAFKLSELGKRVGMIDFDYDAPGLIHLLSSSLGREVEVKKTDLLKIITYNSLAEVPEAVIVINENLWLLPSNPVFEDMKSVYEIVSKETGDLEQRFENVLRVFEERFKLDYVLVDLRTGHSFLIYAATELADLVIQVFRLNSQDLYGTRIFARALRPRGNRVNLLIPSLVPMTVPGYEARLQQVMMESFGTSAGWQHFVPVLDAVFLDDRILQVNESLDRDSQQYRQMQNALEFIVNEIQA